MIGKAKAVLRSSNDSSFVPLSTISYFNKVTKFQLEVETSQQDVVLEVLPILWRKRVTLPA